MTLELGARRGPTPRTRQRLPHAQLDQQPSDTADRDELFNRGLGLAGVRQAASTVSVPGAVALVLDDHNGPPDAFLADGEFAHFHPPPDLSLHLTVPPDAAREVLAGGWGEPHYLAARGELPATHLMIYAPRDRAELDAVWKIIQASHTFAQGPPRESSATTRNRTKQEATQPT
jgi:hypothetical protein